MYHKQKDRQANNKKTNYEKSFVLSKITTRATRLLTAVQQYSVNYSEATCVQILLQRAV